MRVAIVHDYLVERAGGDRVVLALAKAFPNAPIHTALYSPDTAFPDFEKLDVRPAVLNRASFLRRRHRWALPFLASTFDRMQVDADVVICSSSGWAHGVAAANAARKIVYCHTPARWLYQSERYLGDGKLAWRLGLGMLRRRLIEWDKRAASTAHLYIANSRVVRERIEGTYGIKAEVLPPPLNLDTEGERRAIPNVQPGYLLCVSRLLPYKNVDRVIEAVSELGTRLIVLGSGPDYSRLRASAPNDSLFLSKVSEAELRWLYANCRGVVAASYEDFGLALAEAAAFGKPAAALRWGGFLDSVIEDRTGVFFDQPEAGSIIDALRRLMARDWDVNQIKEHAVTNFAESSFIDCMQRIVEAEWARGQRP